MIETEQEPEEFTERHLVLRCAATIKPKRVRWLWEHRLALGTLSLLAGREGLGKSSVAVWIIAQITRGTLPGEHLGQPRAVLVCATEDSWEHTIVPRLMAAGADLTKVFAVEMVSADGIQVGLSLPRDNHRLEATAIETDAAMLVLDPLMSRLGESLDSHRDADVRRALEPLVAIADRTHMAVLGLIHHNKSGSTDPLQLVMGSKAFTAVARSVHTVVPDPDDETEKRRLFGTPKNNLGTTDLDTLAFTMTGYPVETDDGTAWTAAVVWGESSQASIGDAMRRSTEPEDRSAVTEAAGWLDDYLTMHGGSASSSDIKRDGAKVGHGENALKRAKVRMQLAVESSGYPRRTYWTLPNGGSPQSDHSQSAQSDQQLAHSPRGADLTELTDPTGGRETQSDQLAQSDQDTGRPVLTGVPTVGICARPGCNSKLTGVELDGGYCWPHTPVDLQRQSRERRRRAS
jgi:hypothetical protein